MNPPPVAKADIFAAFHQRLQGPVEEIRRGGLSSEKKAQAVNRLVNDTRATLATELRLPERGDRQFAGLVLQYCYSVMSLEYRHRAWPYEYMAFSRRVGELWEQFCSTAWDYPSSPAVQRITPPEFDDVKRVLLNRIEGNLEQHANRAAILTDVALLFDIIGEINMREDEVFSVNNVPHVIDFKSGFGSNEKGNMLRLKTVGEAYRIWNHDTQLLLLVRQDENNNYLEVLRRARLWAVHTGNHAYAQIENFTGAPIQSVRERVIDWERDLSADFWAFLRTQPRDLTGYLAW